MGWAFGLFGFGFDFVGSSLNLGFGCFGFTDLMLLEFAFDLVSSCS